MCKMLEVEDGGLLLTFTLKPFDRCVEILLVYLDAYEAGVKYAVALLGEGVQQKAVQLDGLLRGVYLLAPIVETEHLGRLVE